MLIKRFINILNKFNNLNYTNTIVPRHIWCITTLLLFLNIVIGYIILSHNKIIPIINNISIHKEDDNLLVMYDIINPLDTASKLPKIRVRLLNNKDSVVSKHITNMNCKLESKEVISIKTKFTEVPANSSKLDLTVGHYLHFVLF